MKAERRESVDWVAWGIALAVAVLAVLYRLAPYTGLFPKDALWNLMPIGALALFAGSRLRLWGVLFPLAVMVVSDLLLMIPLGTKALSWDRPVIYACFALYSALGLLIRRDKFSPLWVTAAALLGSAQFFLITNFFSWWEKVMPYSNDLAGLMQCYTLALPFHQNTLVADVTFSLSFFALHLFVLAVVSSPEGTREGQPVGQLQGDAAGGVGITTAERTSVRPPA